MFFSDITKNLNREILTENLLLMDGMGLKMKNSQKNLIGGGGHKKPIYRGNCLKRGLGKKRGRGYF